VVSLVPSITETLHDLGAGDVLVGVTDFCIFPEHARLRARPVGGTKNPDVELIRHLAPDLVHANLEENLKRHADAIEQFAPVFVSEPRCVPDVIDLLGVLGSIHGVEVAAGEWAARIEDELALPVGKEFTFLCPIWKDPWMWCGGDTYVSALVTSRGGRNRLEEQRRYPKVGLSDALALKPDVLFLPDEPYAFNADDAHALGALTAARVVGPFPGHLFTWHGTRTLAGLRFLNAETLTG
jgi:ABC-type Fe3+-hydroxamate transport system substrate-binding protein